MGTIREKMGNNGECDEKIDREGGRDTFPSFCFPVLRNLWRAVQSKARNNGCCLVVTVLLYVRVVLSHFHCLI